MTVDFPAAEWYNSAREKLREVEGVPGQLLLTTPSRNQILNCPRWSPGAGGQAWAGPAPPPGPRPATFLSRPNRFIAQVELDGAVETVHVKNTGRSSRVQPFTSTNPRRGKVRSGSRGGPRAAASDNSFIAQVELDGAVETVHVKNTGRCRELLVPGCTVYLERCPNPARKTKFDLIAVEKARPDRIPAIWSTKHTAAS